MTVSDDGVVVGAAPPRRCGHRPRRDPHGARRRRARRRGCPRRDRQAGGRRTRRSLRRRCAPRTTAVRRRGDGSRRPVAPPTVRACCRRRCSRRRRAGGERRAQRGGARRRARASTRRAHVRDRCRALPRRPTSKPGRGATRTRGNAPSARSRAACIAAVPRGIAHLRPLVGAHHDDVVARGDVGDQLRVGDGDARARGACAAARRIACGARFDTRVRAVFLAQRDARQREIEAIEFARCRCAASAIARCATVSGSNDPG